MNKKTIKSNIKEFGIDTGSQLITDTINEIEREIINMKGIISCYSAMILSVDVIMSISEDKMIVENWEALKETLDKQIKSYK